METPKKDLTLQGDVLKIQVPKKLPSLNSPPKARFAPISKPAGIDPVEIMKEREFRSVLINITFRFCCLNNC